MASHETVVKVLAVLSAAYPHFKAAEPKRTQQVYEELLIDIPDDLLRAAAQQCATSGTFFPSVAELRKAALDIRNRAAGELTAEEAWEEVMHQIRAIGSWRVPEWSTALVGRVVSAMGGWRSLCLSENGVADRAHFMEIYVGLAKRENETRAMLPQVREIMQRLATAERKELPCPSK